MQNYTVQFSYFIGALSSPVNGLIREITPYSEGFRLHQGSKCSSLNKKFFITGYVK
ncbi:hypothetical protein [Dickeya dianthicola]|uniref:hypothetical protein n=1 Tax=Dickeya dianthicola TaxID=204039 RepID=UPI0018684434|nr:hypothetical protein [Dickeya dianthicola]QOL14645.1 hypothetical protein HGI48_10750 [Dickeya dianthicola]